MNHHNLLLIQMAKMGDILQTIPLMKGLRRIYPAAHLSVLMDNALVPSLGALLPADECMGLDIQGLARAGRFYKDNLPEHYRYFSRALRSLEEKRYDTVLNINFSRITALLTAFLGTGDVKGYRLGPMREIMPTSPWLAYILSVVHSRVVNRINLVDVFYRSVIRKGKGEGLMLALPGNNDHQAFPSLIDEKLKGIGSLVAFQLGSKHLLRRWPTAKYAALAKRLIEGCGARIMLLGTNSERGLGRAFISELEKIQPDYAPSLIDLMGKTDIMQLATCLKKADLLVTGDTGTMHLAAALDVPVLALFFGPAWAHETGPYGKGHRVIQVELSCGPCLEGEECPNPICREAIGVELAFETALEMTTARSGHRLIGTGKGAGDNGKITVYESDMDGWGAFLRPLIPRALGAEDVFGIFYRDLGRRVCDRGYCPDVERLFSKVQAYAPPTRETLGMLGRIREVIREQGIRSALAYNPALSRFLSPLAAFEDRLSHMKRTGWAAIKEMEGVLDTAPRLLEAFLGRIADHGEDGKW